MGIQRVYEVLCDVCKQKLVRAWLTRDAIASDLKAFGWQKLPKNEWCCPECHEKKLESERPSPTPSDSKSFTLRLFVPEAKAV